jgi:DNA-binding sugar fermentation-stimulating protein
MNVLYKFDKVYKAKVLERPSKICKSPYLADIQVFGEDNEIIDENVMAHSPALGCCGLLVKDTNILVTKSANPKNKSKYVIHHVYLVNPQNQVSYIIGINPMLGNPITRVLLERNMINPFTNVSDIQPEVTMDESRFDFTFLHNGQPCILEVKCVPLADYVDVSAKERKKLDLSNYQFDEKIAIFPDGYRKNQSEPVSERAVKHANHLKELQKTGMYQCAIVFLIQRRDVVAFKPSNLDPIYKKALYDAEKEGVLVLPIVVNWNNEICEYVKTVPLLVEE